LLSTYSHPRLSNNLKTTAQDVSLAIFSWIQVAKFHLIVAWKY
jgi:hypothetical protein